MIAHVAAYLHLAAFQGQRHTAHAHLRLAAATTAAAEATAAGVVVLSYGGYLCLVGETAYHRTVGEALLRSGTKVKIAEPAVLHPFLD